MKLLETKLSLEYFGTLTATSGTDALAIWERGLCDLVLLDVMTPGMDWFKVCRRLKSNSATEHLPVVIVMALDPPADRLRGLEAGADDFLTKPIDDTALFTRVRRLLRLKVVTDELRCRTVPLREVDMGDSLALAAAETGFDTRWSRTARPRKSAWWAHSPRTTASPSSAIRIAPWSWRRRAITRPRWSAFDLNGFDGLRLCS